MIMQKSLATLLAVCLTSAGVACACGPVGSDGLDSLRHHQGDAVVEDGLHSKNPPCEQARHQAADSNSSDHCTLADCGDSCGVLDASSAGAETLLTTNRMSEQPPPDIDDASSNILLLPPIATEPPPTIVLLANLTASISDTPVRRFDRALK